MLRVTLKIGDITATVEREGTEEDIDTVTELIKGALVACGYLPSTVDEMIP
jgi:hypothetical protein